MKCIFTPFAGCSLGAVPDDCDADPDQALEVLALIVGIDGDQVCWLRVDHDQLVGGLAAFDGAALPEPSLMMFGEPLDLLGEDFFGEEAGGRFAAMSERAERASGWEGL